MPRTGSANRTTTVHAHQFTSREQYAEYQRKRRARLANEEESDPSYSPASRRKERTFWQLLGEFLRLVKGERNAVIFALATLTVATLLKLVPPVATKLVIDYVLGSRPIPERWARWWPASLGEVQLLLVIGLSVISLTLLATLLHLSGRWFATKAVNKVQVHVRRRAFEHAVRLPLHRVYQLKSGGVASLLREDAGGVGDLIFSMLYNPWRAIIQLIGSLFVLVWVDWRLMLCGLMLLPIVYFTHRTWVQRIRPVFRDVRAQRQEIDSHTTEAFGGMRVVRTFNRERSEAGRFVRSNNLMVRQQLFVWWWSRLINLLWDTLIPLASTALLLYGGYRVLQGQLTLGDLTMFLVYLAMLLGPIATLATSATTFQNNLAGMERVLDLLAEPSEAGRSVATSVVTPSQVQGRIEFRSVAFQYPGSGSWVLQDINLQVAAGETVALVGRSGAGKTTLCNLVARFYNPTEGMLTLDGRDMRQIDLCSYRRLLGIVEQDVFLFDGSIAENIGYARCDATRQQIVAAARVANAEEFIDNLPAGYDTRIGERGVRLSGGQRQRLAIARAVLADPRILVLDEATSNLDSESERLIQQSLRKLMQNRTSFVIAHRLSTITHANRIVVLEQGRIAETGTHTELLSRSGHYRQMVELQADLTCVDL